jgi:hypothetical protein
MALFRQVSSLRRSRRSGDRSYERPVRELTVSIVLETLTRTRHGLCRASEPMLPRAATAKSPEAVASVRTTFTPSEARRVKNEIPQTGKYGANRE